MMVRILLLKICILLSVNFFSQPTWMPCSNGIYASPISYVSALTTFNNKLILSGLFSITWPTYFNLIASWDGSNFNTVGGGLNNGATNPTIYKLCEYNNNLYAITNPSSSTLTGVSQLAKFDGNSWSYINLNNSSAILNDMCVFNNELVVTGTFTGTGSVPAQNIARWNGSSWSSLGSGINVSLGGKVGPLIVFNNELYVGGSFTLAGGVPVSNIAKWDGTSWSTVGAGIPTALSHSAPYGVTAFGIYNSELYAGNLNAGLSKWNGTQWLIVGGGVGGWVNAMTNFNGKLIIGGYFNSAGGCQINNIAAWDNVGWSSVVGQCGGDGLNGRVQQWPDYGTVQALATFSNELYAGGSFTSATINQQVVNNNLTLIAHYSGVLGVEDYYLERNVRLTPNPGNGKFTFTGLIEKNTIEVFDLTGRIVYCVQSNDPDITIDLINNDQGIYFYKISNDLKIIQQGKIVLQK